MFMGEGLSVCGRGFKCKCGGCDKEADFVVLIHKLELFICLLFSLL